jgi:hypothetical protein
MFFQGLGCIIGQSSLCIQDVFADIDDSNTSFNEISLKISQARPHHQQCLEQPIHTHPKTTGSQALP